jgi:hypothetical protein
MMSWADERQKQKHGYGRYPRGLRRDCCASCGQEQGLDFFYPKRIRNEQISKNRKTGIMTEILANSKLKVES